jgi:hypothetical protein
MSFDVVVSIQDTESGDDEPISVQTVRSFENKGLAKSLFNMICGDYEDYEPDDDEEESEYDPDEL